jgi:catechol 2,3-dioxygenase-like lactoylglutathione lyase family enzyme
VIKGNRALPPADRVDRFVEFYVDVFDVEPVFTETTPAFRHSILRTSPSSWLHPVQVADNPHATALPDTFARGHLDHLALTARDAAAFEEARGRLLARRAGDGVVETLGSFHSVWFVDPDGMCGELVLIIDPALTSIHAPQPF